MSSYYNEHDPVAAEWLRELIKAGLIAPGVVDERSIEDVTPSELSGFTQCHFFAGIGIWSLALRLAGWPDDRPVWTGSCPCQPFSAAGKGEGLDDERHLWPAFFHLIRFCRPGVVFGEQVASRGGLGWLDIVQADMEAEGYAIGAVDLCAAGFGSPQIRQRLYFVADAYAGRRKQRDTRIGSILLADADRAHVALADPAGWDPGTKGIQRSGQHGRITEDGGAGELGDATNRRRGIGGHASGARRSGHFDSAELAGELVQSVGEGPQGHARNGDNGHQQGRFGTEAIGHAAATGHAGRMADTRNGLLPQQGRSPQGRDGARPAGAVDDSVPGPTNGFWADVDWLRCRDERWRPVEAGTFPLAHGNPGRLGRLRGYGNSISPWPAKAVIEAYQESRNF